MGILARIAETENNWNVQLLYMLYACYSIVHKVTKETPFFIVYERDPNRPLNSTLHTWRAERVGVKEYMCKVVERIKKARKKMKIKTKGKEKERYDEERKES